jgi:hypothetical protein
MVTVIATKGGVRSTKQSFLNFSATEKFPIDRLADLTPVLTWCFRVRRPVRVAGAGDGHCAVLLHRYDKARNARVAAPPRMASDPISTWPALATQATCRRHSVSMYFVLAIHSCIHACIRTEHFSYDPGAGRRSHFTRLHARSGYHALAQPAQTELVQPRALTRTVPTRLDDVPGQPSSRSSTVAR